MFIIYKLTSPSGKSYIGQTKRGLHTRFTEHIAGWKRWNKRNCPRKSYQTKLFYAFNAYSPETFLTEILFEVNTIEEADKIEIKFIKKYNCINEGYNLTKGGHGHRGAFNNEHKNKLGQSRKKYFETQEGQEWKEKLKGKFQINNPCKKGHIPWNLGAKSPQCGNGKAKTYKVISPIGEIIIVTNMTQWCKQNGLDNRNITCSYGSKGYKAILLP